MPILLNTLGAVHRKLSDVGTFDADPEGWHAKAMKIGDWVENNVSFILEHLKRSTTLDAEYRQEVQIGTVTLANSVGLAAGFAKQPHGLKTWEALGFGWISIGGITRDAQPGRPDRPRVWRHKKERGARNFLGFPGPGRDEVISMLEERRDTDMGPQVPIFANLASSKSVLDKYMEDKNYDPVIKEFTENLEEIYEHVDGIEVNVSCPNQAGVTSQQDKDKIGLLLKAVVDKRDVLARVYGIKKPILVKVAPLTTRANSKHPIKDQTEEGLLAIIEACNANKVDAVVATNTSLEHHGRITGQDRNGGLSGLPIVNQSISTVKFIREHLDKDIKIIGVGGLGFDNGESAIEMMEAGADAVQMYTGLTYDISAPYRIKKAIQRHLSSKAK